MDVVGNEPFRETNRWLKVCETLWKPQVRAAMDDIKDGTLHDDDDVVDEVSTTTRVAFLPSNSSSSPPFILLPLLSSSVVGQCDAGGG